MSYAAYHAPRFRFALRLAEESLPPGARRALDVGPSPLTALLRERLPVPVDTLGLEADGSERDARHYHADLNDPASLAAVLPDAAYDLIVFAEVIEHLTAPPTTVLPALRRLLRGGGVLLLQTPNAASLPKRLKLLAGRNPYELLRPDRNNPGHIREYTLTEIRACSRESGFRIVATFRRFYFDARFARHADPSARPQLLVGSLKNAAYRVLPPFLREGITVVLRRDS